MITEFLQGLFACIIAAGFLSTALICASCALSGRHAAQERFEEDRRRHPALERKER